MKRASPITGDGGNLGVYVLRRIKDERAHFLAVSFWESTSAIEGFAGSNPERAKYYPEDIVFLLGSQPSVEHYGVLVGPRLLPERGA